MRGCQRYDIIYGMEKNTPSSESQLITELQKLAITIRKSNSLWRSFLKGVASALGGLIATALVTGVVITILSQTIRSIYDVPIIGNIISTSGLGDLLQIPEDTPR